MCCQEPWSHQKDSVWDFYSPEWATHSLFTDSFTPRRFWPLSAFWTQALIILVENKTCHLAASITQVLSALSVLQSLAFVRSAGLMLKWCRKASDEINWSPYCSHGVFIFKKCSAFYWPRWFMGINYETRSHIWAHNFQISDLYANCYISWGCWGALTNTDIVELLIWLNHKSEASFLFILISCVSLC